METNMVQHVTSPFADDESPHPNGKNWLSGNEVIRRTGISKSDLIRFIQLGVFPKSMMRVSSVGREGAQKKSYFSAAILGHVAMLKLLREEGHSIETITQELRQAEETSPLPQDPASPTPTPPASAVPAEPSGRLPRTFHLSTDAIATASFLVDPNLRIDWINAGPGDRLAQAVRSELADDPSGTVFDILLRASLKALVFNWQPLFDFIFRFLKAVTPPDRFDRLAPTVSLNGEKSGPWEPPVSGQSSTGLIDSCLIRFEDRQGRMQEMRLYGIHLSEGVLFLWDQERRRGVAVDDAGAVAAAVVGTDGEPASGKTPFGVISVRLDDSRSIVDTLLPETYFELMTRIWDESDQVLAAYGGHRAKRSGTEVQYIIPRHSNRDPAYDAICCAVQLQAKMAEMEASMKSDGGWFFDIRLNIGISSGRDHLQEEDPTASMAFMLPGGAADQAFHLSAIAHGGGIWITKSAFSHLMPQQVKHIRFGIYRGERLIPNIFTQVSELPHAPDTPPPGQGIRSLFVTQIIDLQNDQAADPHPDPSRP